MVCYAASLTALAVWVLLLGGKKNGTLRQPCPRDQEREIHPFTTCIKRNNFRFCRTVWETEVCFLHIQLMGTNVWLSKIHKTLLKSMLSIQDLRQSQSLETVPVCIVVLCFPHDNIAQIHSCSLFLEIERAERQSQALVHFVTRSCKFVYLP